MPVPPAARVSCRPIEAADLVAITDLLHAGFPKRPRRYWVDALDRLTAREVPAGLPRYGYLLQSGGQPVGVLLLIFSAGADGGGSSGRGNVSSWYVQPAFGPYAPLLVLRGIRHKVATYLNVSPAPETLRIIAAQGFRQYSEGVFAAVPWLVPARGGRVRRVSQRADGEALGIPAADCRLLTDHTAFGCLGMWCETAAGGQPLIVRRRLVKPGIPCAQLIYCRSLADLEAMAGPVGRFLAMRGMPLLLVAANRPLRGVPGRFFAGKLPMYFKGTEPRPGDLSYTEAALLGL